MIEENVECKEPVRLSASKRTLLYLIDTLVFLLCIAIIASILYIEIDYAKMWMLDLGAILFSIFMLFYNKFTSKYEEELKKDLIYKIIRSLKIVFAVVCFVIALVMFIQVRAMDNFLTHV